MVRSAFPRTRLYVTAAILTLTGLYGSQLSAQGLGGAGTVQGVVRDSTGGVLPGVTLTIKSPVSGFNRMIVSDDAGKFAFTNLPENHYHISATLQGFSPVSRDVDVRSGVPIEVPLSMAVAGASTSVEVVGHSDLVERDSTAHTDIDQAVIARMASEISGGLNRVVMMASPGIVADSNSFFHPIGDHAQTQFSIDNQPVTDQQSRVYSNQISSDAVQSMEIITGVAPAEYGDKSSLVVHIVTKSGLGQKKPSGTVTFGYGSFTSPTGEINLGAGSDRVGNFLSASGTATDRYLDTPEFTAIHGHGTSQSLFDRLDFKPGAADSFHIDLQAANSAFDVPNTFDTADATQHQRINTFNFAPGYSRVIGTRALLTANGFVRRDHLTYSPSTDPFADTPATVSQDRTLTNFGGKVDVTYTAGVNNLKFGGAASATRLHENFTLGFTDAAFNSPCLDAGGSPVGDPSLTRTNQCAGATLSVNPDFSTNFLTFDLTRGGTRFGFDDHATIKQASAYIQDEITVGDINIKLGVRVDRYAGLSSQTKVQPRLGIAYSVPGTSTILRASYGRTMETPYNEGLLLSSGFGGSSALVGTSAPLPTGLRQQYEIGIQQGFGGWLVADVGYFNKKTTNAYDFNVLFDTPIVFPVAWDHSRIDGFTGRLNLVEHGGFSAFVVMAHTNAIFTPPGTGGVLLEDATADFRIDHDQKFNSTTNAQYTFDKVHGAWASFSWRYDSGLVAGAVPDFATALSLTGDQQAAIGLFCGATFASPSTPLTGCAAGSSRGATRLVIPADGAADDVANPPRIAPRHLFDAAVGIDNLLKTKSARLKLRLSVVNLANKEALYNFLSTFSGTHFVTPRAYQFQLAIAF
jgi:hypothetical protein